MPTEITAPPEFMCMFCGEKYYTAEECETCERWCQCVKCDQRLESGRLVLCRKLKWFSPGEGDMRGEAPVGCEDRGEK